MKHVLRLLAFVAVALVSLSAHAQTDTTSAQALMAQGDRYRQAGKVQQALLHYFRGLRQAEEHQERWLIIQVSERLGDLHEKYYRYQESIPYLMRSYSLLHKTDSIAFLAAVTNSIAWNYIKIGVADSAVRYAEEAVSLYRSMSRFDTLNYCVALESLGEIYSEKKRYADAETIFAQSMDLGRAAGNVVIQGFTNYGFALNAFNQGNLARAESSIGACVPVAEKYASPELLADVYWLAFRISDARKEQQEAFHYLRKFSELKERLHSEDIEKKAAIINANFEIQKKEDDLRLLSQQNAIQQLEIEQRSLAQKITIGAILALIIIAALIYNRIQSQRKFEKKELQRKNEELEQARKVQLSLLPKKPYTGDSFDVFGKMITATEVGGDYYDFIKLDDHRMLIAFGDATGHGMTAGMMVTITKVALINNLSMLKDSNDVVPVARAINESILSSISVKGIGMALQLCIIDTSSNMLFMTSCGMPYPMVVDTTTGATQTPVIHQPPLGFMRGTKMELTQLPFTASNLLVLASDGILERFNKAREEYGADRLLGLLKATVSSHVNLQHLLDAIFQDTETYAESIPHHDDMTALCARMK